MTTNSRRHTQAVRYCNPNCQFFKCEKRALGSKEKIRGRSRITCNFVEGDLCTGSRCNYSFCVKHKLKPDGTCGLNERKKNKLNDEIIEKKYEKELLQKEQQANKYESYMKDKYRKKLKGIKQ
ncbi:MAG: hypothetical protein ACFFD2_17935 [Promethearchaeota archaeon]